MSDVWVPNIGWVSPGSEYYVPPAPAQQTQEQKKQEVVTRGDNVYLIPKRENPAPEPISLPNQGGSNQFPAGAKTPEDVQREVQLSFMRTKQVPGGSVTEGPPELPVSIKFQDGRGEITTPAQFQGTIIAGGGRKLASQPKPASKNELSAQTKHAFARAPVAAALKAGRESEFTRGAAETVPYGVALGALAVASPVAGSVAVGGLLGYSVVSTGADFAERGVERTIRENFLSKRALGQQAGFVVGGAGVVKGPTEYKVTTAEGLAVSESGASKGGLVQRILAVKPLGVEEYFTRSPPQTESVVRLLGKEHTKIASKGAALEMVAAVKKTAPRELVEAAPKSSGYPGTTKLFDAAKAEAAVNKSADMLLAELRNTPPESRPQLPGMVGEGRPQLSPTSWKLLDAIDVGLGVKTQVRTVYAAEGYGNKIKIPVIARENTLKSLDTGEVLKPRSEVEGTVNLPENMKVYGSLKSGSVSKYGQAGDHIVFKLRSKVEGNMPDLAYTRKGAYRFVAEKEKTGPQTVILKAPQHGVMRNIVESVKAIKSRTTGLRLFGRQLTGKKGTTPLIRFLQERYAKAKETKVESVHVEAKQQTKAEVPSQLPKQDAAKPVSTKYLHLAQEERLDMPVYERVSFGVEKVVSSELTGALRAGPALRNVGVSAKNSAYVVPSQLRAQVRVSAAGVLMSKQDVMASAKQQVQLQKQIQLQEQIGLQKQVQLQEQIGVVAQREVLQQAEISRDAQKQRVVLKQIQVPRQVQKVWSRTIPKRKLVPPEVPKRVFKGSEIRRGIVSVKKIESGQEKKLRGRRLRLATWENVDLTEASLQRKATHSFLKGRMAREYDVRAAIHGASFRYPTQEQKRGLL